MKNSPYPFVRSMTGFALASGQSDGFSWTWEVRSVNGKGLDVRVRVPDWLDGLEQPDRSRIARAVTRGNVSLTLKITREDGAGQGIRVNPVTLAQALTVLGDVQAAALRAGVTLQAPTAADIAGIRGVIESRSVEDLVPALRIALLVDLPQVMDQLDQSRLAEGMALARVIAGQIDRIADLLVTAHAAAAERGAQARDVLQQAVAQLVGAAAPVDPARLAQELALLAVKTDVTEELDRLTAHVAAARSLLQDTGPIGRKFDFLTQEFMREANTLCAKAQSIALTRVGLDLKVVIDQMREQVQNLE